MFQGKPKTDQVITMTEGNVHIRSWEEFKRTVNEKKPASIVFILEQNGFSPNKELTTLKLIMLHDKRYYIFYDFPKGDTLRKQAFPCTRTRTAYPT